MATTASVTRQLHDLVRDWIQQGSVARPSASTLVALAARMISSVEKMVTERYKGKEKKRVVLEVLSLVVEEQPWASEDDKQAAKHVLAVVVPAAIDTIVDAANGDIDFQSFAQRWNRFWRTCCACCCCCQSNAAAAARRRDEHI